MEFVLTVVFVTMLLFSILEIILFVQTYSVLADSAKEGVRYAIVHGSGNLSPSGPTCGGSPDPCADIDGPAGAPGTVPGYGSGYGVVKTYAVASLHDTTAMTVTVDYNPNSDNGAACNKTPCLVRVTVRYPYQPFFGMGWPTVTVYAAAEGRIAY